MCIKSKPVDRAKSKTSYIEYLSSIEETVESSPAPISVSILLLLLTLLLSDVVSLVSLLNKVKGECPLNVCYVFCYKTNLN